MTVTLHCMIYNKEVSLSGEETLRCEMASCLSVCRLPSAACWFFECHMKERQSVLSMFKVV